MDGSKIAAQNLSLADKLSNIVALRWAPVGIVAVGALFNGGCVMTKAQGDRLTEQVREIEDEVAKLQRVRHDMETLLLGQVRDLVDRIARLENHLATLRESLTEGSSRNTELVAELQNLRSELENAQHLYRNLEQGQASLAKNQNALKEAQNKIRIPPLKEDHFALAKKLYLGGKYDEAIFLFEQFIAAYPQDKDLTGQCYYLTGEINKKLADGEKSAEDAEKYYKRAVVSYQKIVEMFNESILREEALYKIGVVLKSMGNKEGAQAAFKELLTKHANGKRVKEAKKQLAELDAKPKSAKK
jgi:TolA-binding protein